MSLWKIFTTRMLVHSIANLDWQNSSLHSSTHKLKCRAYFNVQLITICAVVKSKCAV